jgi:hypothetical protein
VLSSVSLSEGDDGSYGDYATRKINYANLQFSAKMYLYGPIKTAPVILNSDINIYRIEDFGKDTATIKKYADIGVSAAAGMTAGGYAPSLTAGWTGAGATHADVVIREYPPTPWGI